MSRLDELLKRYEEVMARGGTHEEAIKSVVSGMFWVLVVAESMGRRNGKLAFIGELADSSEAVAHKLIDEVLDPPSRYEAMVLGRRIKG